MDQIYSMLKLSPLDTLFLLLERRHAPFHVGALSLFRPPAGSPEDFGAQLVARLNARSIAEAPFDRRLVTHHGLNYWESDPEFELNQHFIHLALPAPGHLDDLPEMVSRIHSALLDRAYPLWRIYLIDGLEDGRIAVYSKIHHSLVDGVAAIRLMLKSMSPDEALSAHMPPPWQVKAVRAVKPDERVQRKLTFSSAIDLARQAANALPGVFKQVKLTALDYRVRHPHLVTSVQAPLSLFNQTITGSRHFAIRSFSTARIKAVADRLGGTSNDVVLALCAAALREYLIRQRLLPDAPLIAAVPVSTRQDDGDVGNEVAGALVNLATHLTDPIERFNAIKGCMDYNKRRMRQMEPAELIAHTALMLAPGLLTLLPGSKRAVANVIISHVRGPDRPMYWQGCLLEGIYPASLLLNGFALNITLVSRHDAIDFGILACRRSVPHLGIILDAIGDALAELEDAISRRAIGPQKVVGIRGASRRVAARSPSVADTRRGRATRSGNKEST